MAKEKSLYPDSVRLCAQTFCLNYKAEGHAALLHTIPCELYYPGNPKGGNGPPKYAPGYGLKNKNSWSFNNTFYIWFVVKIHLRSNDSVDLSLYFMAQNGVFA